MARHVLFLMSLASVFPAFAAAEEPKTAEEKEEKPQWQRLLQGDDAKNAAELQEKINAAEKADQYDQAIKLHEELVALRTTAQGAEHWETVNARWQLDAARKVAALTAQQRDGWREAVQGAFEAQKLEAKGRYADAQPLWEEYRRQGEQILGHKHRDTAASYNILAQPARPGEVRRRPATSPESP